MGGNELLPSILKEEEEEGGERKKNDGSIKKGYNDWGCSYETCFRAVKLMGKKRGQTHTTLLWFLFFLSLLHPSTLRDGDNVLKERKKEKTARISPAALPDDRIVTSCPLFSRDAGASQQDVSNHLTASSFPSFLLFPLLPLFLEGDAKGFDDLNENARVCTGL